MEHQKVDEVAKPSEKVIAQHVAIAAVAWQECEDDEPLVSFGSLNTNAAVAGLHSSGGRHGSTGGKKPGPVKATKGKAVAPNVEAARQRAKTAQEWKRVEATLEKALQLGSTILEKDAVAIHESQEKVLADCSLDLLRNRMDLIRLATSRSTTQDSKEQSRQLFQKCLCDPYLKDLSGTLLSVEEGCQTVGAAIRCRDILLDLQPTVERVHELMDSHRNGMTLLRTIASCVQTEAEGWKANAQALIKAKADEVKAIEKANEKEKNKRHYAKSELKRLRERRKKLPPKKWQSRSRHRRL